MIQMYGTWQARFNARQDIVGETIILDGAPYTVIGVLPREFHFAFRAAEFWTTFHAAWDLGESTSRVRLLERYPDLRAMAPYARAETMARKWKFDQMVADGRMPKPKRIDGRVVWDRLQLDSAFAALPDEDGRGDDIWSKIAV